MPDFDKLHDLTTKLSELTSPGGRQEGLGTWAMMVGKFWKEISEMWDGPPQPKAKDKTVILSVADGPESIEIYTSEDEAVQDFAETIPALYITASLDDAYAKLGPFRLPAILHGVKKAVAEGKPSWAEIGEMNEEIQDLKAKIIRITELFQAYKSTGDGGAIDALEDFIVNHCGEGEL